MGILRFSKREKKQPILARSYSSTASCRHAEQKDNNLNQERVALTDEFISGSAFRAILNDDNGGTLLDNILTELRPHCTDSQVEIMRSYPSSSTVSLNNSRAFHQSSKDTASAERASPNHTEQDKKPEEDWLDGEEWQFEDFLAKKYIHATRRRQQRLSSKEIVSRPSDLKDRQQRQPPVWSIDQLQQQQQQQRHSSSVFVSPSIARHSSTSSPLSNLRWRASSLKSKSNTQSRNSQTSKEDSGNIGQSNRRSSSVARGSQAASPALENRRFGSGNASAPTPPPDSALHGSALPTTNRNALKGSDRQTQGTQSSSPTKGRKIRSSGTESTLLQQPWERQQHRQQRQSLVPNSIMDTTEKRRVDKATMTSDLQWCPTAHLHCCHYHQCRRQQLNCCVTPNAIRYPGTGETSPPSCVAQMPCPAASCCHSHKTPCAHVQCYSRNHRSCCSGTRSSSTIIETRATTDTNSSSNNESTNSSISSCITCSSDTQSSLWHPCYPCHRQHSPCGEGGCFHHHHCFNYYHHHHHHKPHHHHLQQQQQHCLHAHHDHHRFTPLVPHSSSSESTQHRYHRHHYHHHHFHLHPPPSHSSQYLCVNHVHGRSSSAAGSRGSFVSADSAV